MWSDKDTDKDFLGYAIHASMLKDVLREPNNLPVTIGLYGDWGCGKSSVLNLLKKQIEDDKDLKDCSIVISFDGWAFESFDDAKVSLINGIITALKDEKRYSKEVKEKVTGFCNKLKSTLFSMRALIWGVKNIGPHIGMAIATHGASIIPTAIGLIKENKSKALKYLEDTLQNLNQEEAYEAVHQFRNDFEELVNATGMDRIVVLIDDLDRCLPRHIIENLEAIKLFLDVPKVAFVIAADETIVSSAIRSELPTIYEQSDKEKSSVEKIGRYYMEKFIQIPYLLPKLGDSEVVTYITLLFCQSLLPKKAFDKVYDAYLQFSLTNKNEAFDTAAIPSLDENKQEYDEVIHTTAFISQFAPIISSTLRRNPRLIKRFLNAYELRVRLLNQLDITDAASKYALLKLMLIELNNEDLFNLLHSYAMKTRNSSEELLQLEAYAQNRTGTIPDSKWDEGIVLDVIKHEPLFSTVNLRELFWVSRDKLVNGMNSHTLIPKWIKDAVILMTQEDITQTEVEAEWNSIQPKLDENGLQDFIAELERHILVHPDSHETHLTYLILSDKDNKFYSSYIKMCTRIDFQALMLFSLKNQFGQLLNNHKDNAELLEIIKSNEQLRKALKLGK